MTRSNKKTPKKKGKHVVYAKPETGSPALIREQTGIYPYVGLAAGSYLQNDAKFGIV